MKFNVLLLITVCAIAGCKGRTVKPPVDIKENIPKVEYIQASYSTQDGGADLEQCRKELDALKSINPTVWDKYSRDFDDLIRRAGVYSSVRGELNPYTQGAIDSYYRFRADKLCSDLVGKVLSELSAEKSR